MQAASLARVSVSSKWHAGLGRDPRELAELIGLCVQREEEAAARPHPGSPTAGTMLACLTRGNLLDVLQEGFNEVTAPLLPPSAPRHPVPPA